MVMTEKQKTSNDRLIGAMRTCREQMKLAVAKGDEAAVWEWGLLRQIATDAWIFWLRAEGLYDE